MKPKEYLLKHGHIKDIGRGRLSRDLIDVINKAVANGEWIEGYSNTPPPVTKAKVSVDKPARTEKVVLELAPILYPEDEFKAWEWSNGKRVERSMRSACNNCRVSLVQNVCDSPTIVARDGRGSVSVTIERA